MAARRPSFFGRFFRPSVPDEVAAELEHHVESAVSDLVAKGVDPDAARAQVRERMGDMDAVRRRLERLGRSRNRTLDRRLRLGEWAQDLRVATRTLRRWPAAAMVVIASLALGIGGSVAVFAVVRAVLLAPLPFADAERLVRLNESPSDTGDRWELSYPTFVDARARVAGIERAIAFQRTSVNLTQGEETIPIPAAHVSVETAGVLGLTPIVGRDLTVADAAEGAPPVVLLSERLWTRRFGGDRDLVGSAILLDGNPVVVTGILPARFRYPDDATEAWLPLGPPQPWMQNRAVHLLQVVARLRPGATPGSATAELNAVLDDIQRSEPGTDPGHRGMVTSLRASLVGDVGPALLLLFGAANAILLLVCVNVGSVTLTRALRRDREIAVRRALGAGTGRIARQLLTESLVLAVAGGVAGLGLAALAVRWLVSAAPIALPRLADARLGGWAVAFAVAAVLVAATVFGIAPVLHGVGDRPGNALRSGAGLTGGNGWQRRLRRGFVALQLALAQVLIVAAGLLVTSFVRLQDVDPGFDPARLLTMTVSLPQPQYSDEQTVRYYEGLPERLDAIPGVMGASAVSQLPLSGGDGYGDLTIEGRPFPPGGTPAASFRRALPGYFRTMRIPLVSGREFDDRDRGEGDLVVIVNETFARRYWPDGGAVGARIKVGPAEREPWLTIVGVVGDVHNVGVAEAPGLATYEPHAQRPGSRMSVVVRTAGNPLALAPEVRRVLRNGDPAVPVVGIGTMAARFAASVSPRRFATLLAGGFGGLAVLIACLGVWGLARHSLTEDRQELGVRAALGADPARLLRTLVGRTAGLAALGVTVGLAASLLVGRLLTHRLFDTAPTDPTVLAVATALVTALAVVATLPSAVAAARTNPADVLRAD